MEVNLPPVKQIEHLQNCQTRVRYKLRYVLSEIGLNNFWRNIFERGQA